MRGSAVQPGSLNRYLYCQNDPVNFMDPSGMRQVAGIYGDGTGRTGTTKTSSIINSVAANISSAASAAASVVKTTTNSVFASNQSDSSPRNSAQPPTAAQPEVRNVGVSLQSCFDPNVVIQDGNTITYMGQRYAIPVGSPISNWTPELVKRYIIPFCEPVAVGEYLPLINNPISGKLNNEAENDNPWYIWHVDSHGEVIAYSLTTIITDAIAYYTSIELISVGVAGAPATAGASLVISMAGLEMLAINGIDIAYDTSTIITNINDFKMNGEFDVNIFGFIVPAIIIDMAEKANNNQNEGDATK